MCLFDADVYKLICTLPFSQGFAISQYLEKYSHSTEGISWVYWLEIIFSPLFVLIQSSAVDTTEIHPDI